MITPKAVRSQDERLTQTLTQEQIRLLDYIQEMTSELGDLAEAGGIIGVSQSLRKISQTAQVLI